MSNENASLLVKILAGLNIPLDAALAVQLIAKCYYEVALLALKRRKPRYIRAIAMKPGNDGQMSPSMPDQNQPIATAAPRVIMVKACRSVSGCLNM